MAGFDYAISPVDSISFKKGRKYIISGLKERSYGGFTFYAKSDLTGKKVFCLSKGCAHLNGRSWTLELNRNRKTPEIINAPE